MPRHSEPITEITIRGKTRWRVIVSITKNCQRKRISKTVDTYGEAKEILAQAQLGDVVPRSRDTFDVWADRWIAEKEDSGIRPVTVSGYHSDLKHPRGAFGTTRIQNIEEDDIKALIRAMRTAGLTKRTTGKALTTMRSVFYMAMCRGILRVNPAEDVAALGADAKERDALTAKEMRLLRDAVRGDRYEACWMLTLAGLRRSELCGLKWSDIDLVAGTLSIERGRGIVGGEQAPKTKRSRRGIPLDTERITLLKEWRSWQAEIWGLAQVRDGSVLINEAGRPMRPEDWSSRWKALCVATADVRDEHTLHAARHSTVTFMRNQGVPDHIVAKFHGHDESVMRRTYSHAHIEELKQAAALVRVVGTS